MESNELTVLRDQIVQAVKDQKEYIEKQLTEIKASGVVSPETNEALERIRTRMDGLEARLNAPDSGTQEERKTVGQSFVECKDFLEFRKRWQKGGCALKLDDAKQDLFPESKTTITIDVVGRATSGVVPITRLPGIVPQAERELRIRDVLPAQKTNASAVDFVQENVFTNAASPQTEASSKAEAALTFTTGSAIVRTISHWIPASRQVLDDLDGLAQFIDHKLMYGLKLKEETEILSGDNLGDHLNGLTTQATAYAGTYAVAGDTKLDTLRHAILEAEYADYPVDAIVLSKKDWHDIELVKTEEGGANKGRYIIGDPAGGGSLIKVPTLWGRPVVASNSMSNGKFLTGGFAMAARIFDRMDAVVDISTEHSDYFVKNLVAIRVEERVCLVVYRPAAFRYGSF